MSSYDIKELADSVESSAYWRGQKAQQYPDDTRNQRSSEALQALARRLRELPRDDAKVSAFYETISRVEALEDAEDMLRDITSEESQYIGRYGFDYPESGEPGPFLEGLTELVADIVEKEEERRSDEEDEAEYEAAKEAADEETKQIADEEAKEAAEEAAKKTAEKAYNEAYEEAYNEAYREALTRTIKERRS